MTLIARIEDELKAARLARDTERRDALSLVLNALRASEKELQRPLSDDEELHVIDHPKYGAVTLSRLLEDMPLGQPTATIRLVCAPELVDEVRPLVEHALGRGRGRR